MKKNKKPTLTKNILSEEEFLPFVQKYANELLSQCMVVKEKNPGLKIFNKKFLGLLIANTRILEDFLDDHGAKKNKTWFYFREIVAAARSFGQTGYLVAFIQKRYLGVNIELKSLKEFIQKTSEVQKSLEKALVYLLEKIEITSDKLGLRHSDSPPELIGEIDFSIKRGQLPVTLDKPDIKDDGKDITKICSLYHNFFQEFQTMDCLSGNIDCQEIKEFIPEIINEAYIRKLELEMHNIESFFDTYVNSRFKDDTDLRLVHLRNYISIPLHLLETARTWSHFYERHPEIHQELHKVIKNECILEYIINWALCYCGKFVSYGKNLAEEILCDYTLEGTVELNIPQKMGFHLRPATLTAKVVNYYGSKVQMIVGEDKFDAGSILSITWAGGKIAREEIKKVTFVGDKRALKDLEILASVNYGEDSMGKDQPLPKELSYLR